MSFGSWVGSWVKRVRGVSNYIVGSCESVAMLVGRLWGGDKGCEGIGWGRVGRVSMPQAPPPLPPKGLAASHLLLVRFKAHIYHARRNRSTWSVCTEHLSNGGERG